MRSEILKKIQDKGLAILKLHEKLNELNIEHEFIDRKEEKTKRIKEEDDLYFVNYICTFDFQILIEENGNQISLIQSPFSYGVTENLIEAYNFQHEPVMLDHEMAAELISKKKLNSYIIVANENKDKELEKIKKVLQLLVEKEG